MLGHLRHSKPIWPDNPCFWYPDTYEGRQMRDIECKQAGTKLPTRFCPSYERDPDSNGAHVQQRGEWCYNRQTQGVRRNNPCFRCPAGYRVWQHAEDDTDPNDPWRKDTLRI